MSDISKLAIIVVSFICLISFYIMGKTIGGQKDVIAAYQTALQECENKDVVDKIFDKIRERHND